MIVEPTPIPDVLLITPPRFLDDRGFFSETWNERRFTEAGGSPAEPPRTPRGDEQNGAPDRPEEYIAFRGS